MQKLIASLTLRTIQTKDIPALLQVVEDQTAPWTEKMFVDVLTTRYKNWVVEYQNEVIGFLIFSQQADEAEIFNIAVKKNFRRQGVARFLLQHMIDFLSKKISKRFSSKFAYQMPKLARFIKSRVSSKLRNEKITIPPKMPKCVKMQLCIVLK